MKSTVVVFGSSRATADSRAWAEAYRLGRLVARGGLNLASGGYAGVMGAASQGAREAGGHVIGVTTTTFEDRAPSADLVEVVEEADYMARMATLLRLGQLFVALPGGIGTASELLAAWCLSSIGQLGGRLYCYRDPWERLLTEITSLEEVGSSRGDSPRMVDTAEELLPELELLANS